MQGARRAPIPAEIHPMLATLVDSAFNDPDWLFEIKWDGYRAIVFIEAGDVRLVSRNQNDLTAQYPELRGLAAHVNASQAVLDGEIVALDEQGRPSFSLMQQRTGMTEPGKRTAKDPTIPIVYYVFDLLYLNGYNIMRVGLEQRKELLRRILPAGPGLVRYSDHSLAQGSALFAAQQSAGRIGCGSARTPSGPLPQVSSLHRVA